MLTGHRQFHSCSHRIEYDGYRNIANAISLTLKSTTYAPKKKWARTIGFLSHPACWLFHCSHRSILLFYYLYSFIFFYYPQYDHKEVGRVIYFLCPVQVCIYVPCPWSSLCHTYVPCCHLSICVSNHNSSEVSLLNNSVLIQSGALLLPSKKTGDAVMSWAP